MAGTLPEQLPAPSILLLEDDNDIGESLHMLLCDAGYKVDVARRVADARELARLAVPQYMVIVADPKVVDSSDGASEMARARQELGLHAGLLLLTAGRMTDEIAKVEPIVQPNEPTWYMEKPFDNDKLLAAIRWLATLPVGARPALDKELEPSYPRSTSFRSG